MSVLIESVKFDYTLLFMAKRHPSLLLSRNKDIKSRYKELLKKHVNWRHDAIITRLSHEFYLAERTISAIINEETVYKKIEHSYGIQLRLI